MLEEVLPFMSFVDQPIWRALLKSGRFASRKHAGQFRDDGITPYYTHCKSVRRILWNFGIRDVETLQIADVHDTVEDTDTTIREIERIFGESFANSLCFLTNETKGNFWKRHEGLLEHGHKMPRKSRNVKLADRLHNLRSCETWDPWRRVRYAMASLELVGCLYPWPNRELALAVRAEAYGILKNQEIFAGNV